MLLTKRLIEQGETHVGILLGLGLLLLGSSLVVLLRVTTTSGRGSTTTTCSGDRSSCTQDDVVRWFPY
jgi:hypothetical protein